MATQYPFGEKYIEKSLSQIGAKVSKATEMTFKAKQLNETSNQLLQDAQTEIADLYESLRDVLSASAESQDTEHAQDAAPKE